MNIRIIYHKDLQQFIESAEYKKSNFLPISSIRALSQVKNPRAHPDDLVLVMAFEQEEMQGYLGVLPDKLYLTDETGIKNELHVGWLSCLWVNPALRGKGIAKMLLETVLENWGNKILATEFTPAAKGLYDKCGQFEDLTKITGTRAYMRSDLVNLLLARNPDKWSKFSILLKLTDYFANIVLNLRRSFFRQKKVNFTVQSELDTACIAFIEQKRSKNEIMRRSTEDLEWILKNPWLESNSQADELSKRYHFSSVSSYFAFKIMKVFNSDMQLVGVLILSIRDKSLKIPYCYCSSDALDIVADSLEKFVRDEKLNILTVFMDELARAIKKNCPSFFVTRKMHRHYIISKNIELKKNHTSSILMQDGDGDSAFT